MPLVIVSGLPCSGKSTRARQLAAHLVHAGSGRSVEVVSEEEWGAPRGTAFADAGQEKRARANFLSAIERRVTKNNIVIADGLNYIKGYRYQLYCAARAASTPHCVLYCVAGEAVCRARNGHRLASAAPASAYPPLVLEELFGRFEEPNNQTRWDSPLFTVDGQDGDEGCEGGWTAVAAALEGAVARPPSVSTAVKGGGGSGGDALPHLDTITQRMLEQIASHVRSAGTPTTVALARCTVSIHRPVLVSELQQIRRQFIHLNRLHPIDPSNIEPLFAAYLHNNLK